MGGKELKKQKLKEVNESVLQSTVAHMEKSHQSANAAHQES